MALQYSETTSPFDDQKVDNIKDQQGVIDELPSLSLDIDDKEITRNLDLRINDSEAYWNDPKGFDLQATRNTNIRYHLGKTEEKGLYTHQKPYKENQLFVAEESIVAYVTSQIAGPLVIPAGKEDKHKLFASDLEKAIKCFCEDIVDLESIVETSVRNILHKKLAVSYFYYDKDLDDIRLEAVDPDHVIVDKLAAKGQNPGFICHILKRTPEQLLGEYPDKADELLSYLGIKRKTPKQMQRQLAVRKVWVTHYDDKGKAQEGCVVYFNDFVLDKYRNPNYLYSKKNLNLLRYPKKPYVFGNLVNYGRHLIDETSPFEQAIGMQEYLARRGRQIGENADKANGVLVIGTSSGLTTDDGQNYTGDPNQKLFVDDTQGKNVGDLVIRLESQTLPDYVIQDKLDARMQVGNIMGAPTDFTGSEAQDGDPTLGQVMIKKNQAAGRQDLMVRAITRMLSEIYEYLVQMFIVWYTDARQFTYDAGDGEFDFITLKRDLIHSGIRVKASKPANPDRSRIEAVVLQLLKEKAISLLDAYKLLQLDNAQQLYDNWAKSSADPMSLARDGMDVIDEAEAYVAFSDIMAGKPVAEKDNPTREYVLSLRKLMINDEFLKAKSSLQNKFVKYVNKCIDSLELRQQLQELSQVDEDNPEALRPQNPLPPLQQPMGQPGTMPQPMPGQAPMQPGMMPPAPMGQTPMPPQLPTGNPPLPTPTPNSVFGGTPIPAPGSAPQPNSGNPASLPMV